MLLEVAAPFLCAGDAGQDTGEVTPPQAGGTGEQRLRRGRPAARGTRLAEQLLHQQQQDQRSQRKDGIIRERRSQLRRFVFQPLIKSLFEERNDRPKRQPRSPVRAHASFENRTARRNGMVALSLLFIGRV